MTVSRLVNTIPCVNWPRKINGTRRTTPGNARAARSGPYLSCLATRSWPPSLKSTRTCLRIKATSWEHSDRTPARPMVSSSQAYAYQAPHRGLAISPSSAPQGRAGGGLRLGRRRRPGRRRPASPRGAGTRRGWPEQRLQALRLSRSTRARTARCRARGRSTNARAGSRPCSPTRRHSVPPRHRSGAETAARGRKRMGPAKASSSSRRYASPPVRR